MSETLAPPPQQEMRKQKTPEEVSEQIHRIVGKLIDRSKHGTDLPGYRSLVLADTVGTVLSGVHISQFTEEDGSTDTNINKRVFDESTAFETEHGHRGTNRVDDVHVDVNNNIGVRGKMTTETFGYKLSDTVQSEVPLTPEQTTHAATSILAEARGRIASQEIASKATQNQLNTILTQR
jgi:hypothetical protein